MKTEQLYTYPTGSYIEFFSVDNQLKVRGPGRDILFINEANIINYETFRQLLLRTKRAIFIDYNPADEFHWIYDKVLTRPDCYFIKSTYNDNPFIPKEQRSEIESYKDADPNFWRIYGEGERGHSEGIIFTHWQPFSAEIPGEIGYGLDFGYNNPTALCRVVQFAGGIQVTEEFYQSKVTNNDLIEVLKQLVSPYDPIYCDAAEPQRIEEIKRAGFKALPANKDVKAGIDFIKSRKLFIHQGSVNLLKEIKSYKFKVNKNKVGNTPEEPLKLNDHCFTGDTLIWMHDGLKPIREVNELDLVYTSKGLRLVLKRWHNGLKQIKDYWLQFDTFSIHLQCTPDHLIKTNKGWTRISKLQSGMTLNFISALTVENIHSIPESDISEDISMQCIGTSGSFTTEKGQKDFTSITLTTTPGITSRIIYVSKNHPITSQNTESEDTKTIQNGLKNFTQKGLKQLKNGIQALMALLGIRNRERELGLIDNTLQKFVNYVETNIKQGTQDVQSTVIRTAKLKQIVEGKSRWEQVYDLTIDDAHEYFAGGLLVHNCMDAMRYAAISFKKKKTALNISFK